MCEREGSKKVKNKHTHNILLENENYCQTKMKTVFNLYFYFCVVHARVVAIRVFFVRNAKKEFFNLFMKWS